jgi:hypothetical protein
MSASTQAVGAVPVAGPITIHNNRALLCLEMFFGVAGWVLSACSVLIAIGSFAPFKRISWGPSIAAGSWLLCAYCMFALGSTLWKWGRRAWKNSVMMDATGVHFQYVSGKGVEKFSFPAGQVVSITHKRVGNYQTYTVHGSDGSTFLFTSYTFLRTKHTARRIAEFCGVQPIQEEK